MTIYLGPSDSINAGATNATTVNYIIMGAAASTTAPTFPSSTGVLASGQLGSSVASLYSPGAGVKAKITRIALYNTSGSVTQVVKYAENGTATSNYTVTITLPVAGWAGYEAGNGWNIYNSAGQLVNSSLGVSSFNTRVGPVTLTAADVEAVTFPLIAYSSYGPGVRALYTPNTTEFAAVDTSNITVTFTAPASGNVVVELIGLAVIGPAAQLYWAVINAATGFVIGPTAQVGFISATLTITPMNCLALVITGLTGGTAYTFYWAAYANTSASTFSLAAGNPGGSTSSPPSVNGAAPATMLVYAG